VRAVTEETRPRVLVIEDERDLRHILSKHLSRLGYQVASAGTGETGLKLAWHDPPDVAFVDYNLPGMNGRDVCEALRADPRTSRCKIIAASALPPEEHGMDAEAALTKPFLGADVARVIELVNQLVGAP
jgi:CheY-like chemotaxis protein